MDFGDIKITGKRVIITPANGTVWLTKHQIADLFGVFISKVGNNIKAILKAGLLDEDMVCQQYRYQNGNVTELYNLEMITALAFRIRSNKADLFRQWLMKMAVQKCSDRQVPIFVSWNNKSLLN
jgi:hypothetical protein